MSTTHPGHTPKASVALLARRRRTRQLARELAGFGTATDRLELETLIEAGSAARTQQERIILIRQSI